MLRAAGDLAQFDGALGVECELLNGPCVDLNLMTSNIDGQRCSTRRAIAMGRFPVLHATGESMLVFPIDARRGDSGRRRAIATVLEPWDLAVLGRDERALGRIARREARPALFSWRP